MKETFEWAFVYIDEADCMNFIKEMEDLNKGRYKVVSVNGPRTFGSLATLVFEEVKEAE